MQIDINSGPRRLGVVSLESQERSNAVAGFVSKFSPQSRLANFADGQFLSFVPGIPKTQLPVPSLEIIANFPQLSTQAKIEQIIVVSELVMSRTGVVNAAKPDSGIYGKTASIGKKIWNSRIRNGEGIKRILKWHTDTELAKRPIRAWNLEWIGKKRNRCQRNRKMSGHP